MESASVISLVEPIEPAPLRQAPYNIEAEQALLGAILINNEALQYLNDRLMPEHFYEPLHTKIFSAIRHFYDKGQISNPITLKHFFDRDETVDIGGGEYLARLASSAVTVINVTDYSDIIYDLALRRKLIELGESVVNRVYELSLEHNAMRQIEAAEQSLFQLAAHGDTQEGFRSFKFSVMDAVKKAEIAFKNKGEVIGVSTGLRDLNKLLGGMQNSDLLILAGRPSMGKTALATTMAYKAALHFQDMYDRKRDKGELAPQEKPQSVGFFSLEMSGEQLATRILSARTNIDSSKILRGELNNEEFAQLYQANTELATLPFYIDDTPALSISALRTRARRLKRVNNLGFLVVDYLQLVRPSTINSSYGRVQEVSEITQGLKAIAKELNIPVMALSQLSRAVEQREDKRPQLSDLRESGSIEQDADVVMFVFREEYYLMRKKPDETTPGFAEWQAEMERTHGIAEAIIAKQRNGPIGNVRMSFFSEQTRFDDLEDESHLPHHY